MSINYGSIGTIMGHELTHGFDDSGREYDKSGMMKQWWNNQTVENFKNASKCMIQQYSQYKIEEESLNGKQTLGRLDIATLHYTSMLIQLIKRFR